MPLAPADFANRAAAAIDDVIGKGDLSKLTPTERVNYYRRVCESLGLNPLTKPFEYVNLGGLKLYATKGCTDQLRDIKKISLPKDRMTKEYDPQTGLYTVEATAVTSDGREDTDIGVVCLKGLSGEALANATMKAMTKAKRRVTLSISGLGWLDETEIETIPGARNVRVDMETGEIMETREIMETPALPDNRLSRGGTPGEERTRAAQRQIAPAAEPEDPIRAERAVAAKAAAAVWNKLTGEAQASWSLRFLHKYGIDNIRMLSISQLREATTAMQNNDWPYEGEYQEALEAKHAAGDEADPFADTPEPVLLEVAADAKGHGDA